MWIPIAIIGLAVLVNIVFGKIGDFGKFIIGVFTLLAFAAIVIAAIGPIWITAK